MASDILSRDFLIREYYENQKSLHEIGREVGCCGATVLKYMRKKGLETRPNSLSVHLAKGNKVSLSSSAYEYVDGLILGDASIIPLSRYSARLSQGFSLKFLEWAKKIYYDLCEFGIKSDLSEKLSYGHYLKDGTYVKPDCSIFLQTLSYEELLGTHKRWYKDKQKIIPEDLVITPTLLRNFYMGDGSPHKNGSYLCVGGFSRSDIGFLIELLNKIGIKSTIHRSANQLSIYIPKNSLKVFFSFIGKKSPVKCFSYKWRLA